MKLSVSMFTCIELKWIYFLIYLLRGWNPESFCSLSTVCILQPCLMKSFILEVKTIIVGIIIFIAVIVAYKGETKAFFIMRCRQSRQQHLLYYFIEWCTCRLTGVFAPTLTHSAITYNGRESPIYILCSAIFSSLWGWLCSGTGVVFFSLQYTLLSNSYPS